MRRIVLAMMLLGSVSVFAQGCPEIGITNQGVIITFLQDNPTGDFEELTYTSNISVDATKKIISYENEFGGKGSYSYSNCGHEISFKKI